ncbi:hypothetical protein [Kordia sp.]|uniref:hypothetical protein n=1 Tax=Kordia sp. TaxID=1965332 RepID=UPI003D6B8863
MKSLKNLAKIGKELTKAEQLLVVGAADYLCWGSDGVLEYSPEDASSHMYHCVPYAVVSASASN